MATASGDKFIRLRNAESGCIIRTLDANRAVGSLSFSPDGAVLASGGEELGVRFWDTETGELLATLRRLQDLRPAGALAFSPDGKTLAVGGGPLLGLVTDNLRSSVVLWDVESKKARKVLNCRPTTVHDVAFSSDGESLAVCGRSAEVSVWNPESGKLKFAVRAGKSVKYDVEFSPENNEFAVANIDNSIEIWDARIKSEKPTRVLNGHSRRVLALAYLQDGTLLSGSRDGSVRVWNTATGKQLKQTEHDEGPVQSVAVSPDGRRFAAGTSQNLHLTSTKIGRTNEPFARVAGGVTCMAVFADDTRVATGGDYPAVQIRDLNTGELVQELPAYAGINTLAVSPDGQWVAGVTADRTTQIWNLTDDSQSQFLGHDVPLSSNKISIGFCPDSKMLLMSCGDYVFVWKHTRAWKPSGKFAISSTVTMAVSPVEPIFMAGTDGWTGQVYNATTKQHLFNLPHRAGVTGGAFSIDGELLATSTWLGHIKTWQARNGQPLGAMSVAHKGSSLLSFAPDGRTLASAGVQDGIIRLWDPTTGDQRAVLSDGDGPVKGLAFLREGSALIAANRAGELRRWEQNNRTIRATLLGHSDGVTCLRFSPDGKLLVSGSRDKTIRVWDVDSRTTLQALTGHNAELTDLVFSPDGETLTSCAYRSTLKMWDTESFTERQTDLRSEPGDYSSMAYSPTADTLAIGVWGEFSLWNTQSEKQGVKRTASGGLRLAYSPDGTYLASAAWNSKNAKLQLWNTATLAPELLKTYDGGLHAVAFSADGKWLATCGQEAWLWDVEKRKEVATLAHKGKVISLAFSPDGKILATAGYDSVVRLWDVETHREVGTLRGHTTYVNSLAFSPDGSFLASGSDDRTIKLWPMKATPQ